MCKSVWVHLVWDPLGFLYLHMFFSFRFGKFSAIISSNTFPILFSLSSPSGIPIMLILACSILSHRSLYCFYFLKNCCSDCIISINSIFLITYFFFFIFYSAIHCLSPWTAAHQAPLSMGVSRQEYWSGVPLPSPSLPLAELLSQQINFLFPGSSLQFLVPFCHNLHVC